MAFWHFFPSFCLWMFLFYSPPPFFLDCSSLPGGQTWCRHKLPWWGELPIVSQMAAISYVPSKETALPALPGPLACTLDCLERVPVGQEGPKLSRLSLKFGVGTSELPPLHCAAMSVHFLPSFFLGREKTPPDPADFWLWLFLSKKVQVQSQTSQSISSGTAISRRTFWELSLWL